MAGPEYLMKSITDRVVFFLPDDRELQWAAMAVVQAYVNRYDEHMARNNQNASKFLFELEYHLIMPPADWAIFQRAGIELMHQPVEHIGTPDVWFDLRANRVASFEAAGKHACQAYGAITGASANPMPAVRKVKPCTSKLMLGYAYGEDIVVAEGKAYRMDLEDVCDLHDDQLTGVVGYASWRTYCAASMGLAVIEVLPKGRSRNWLSKFTNPLYYACTEDGRDEQIASAMADLEKRLCTIPAAIVPG